MGMAKKMVLAPALALPPGDLSDGNTLFARASVPPAQPVCCPMQPNVTSTASRAQGQHSGFHVPDEAPIQ